MQERCCVGHWENRSFKDDAFRYRQENLLSFDQGRLRCEWTYPWRQGSHVQSKRGGIVIREDVRHQDARWCPSGQTRHARADEYCLCQLETLRHFRHSLHPWHNQGIRFVYGWALRSLLWVLRMRQWKRQAARKEWDREEELQGSYRLRGTSSHR